MRIIHCSDGWGEDNGAARIARLIAKEQEITGNGVLLRRWTPPVMLRSCDQVWVHCGWKPCLWWAALWGHDVHWMPEACYDPVRLKFHGWKKKLVGAVERFFLRRVSVVVATCPAEAAWIRAYEPHVKQIEVTDIKRFFRLEQKETVESKGQQQNRRKCFAPPTVNSEFRTQNSEPVGRPVSRVLRGNVNGGRFPILQPPNHPTTQPPNLELIDNSIHLLYLGRRHPLKGLEYLELALEKCGNVKFWNCDNMGTVNGNECGIVFRVESHVFGEEKERVWDWCDVLVLPTLSENFGLVVAEALEHGKRVVVTDGAPAWDPDNEGDYGGRLMYLRGYRDGSPEERVDILLKALKRLLEHRE